jgi:23S rRNA pseudouridine1911/1915/1917 synthase
LITSSEGKDQRLDIFLAQSIRGLSRSQIKKIITEKKAIVDGQEKKGSYRLREGEKVDIHYDPTPLQELEPEEISLDVIYSDNDILVIEKPSGLIVHPGAGALKSTLVNALLFHFPELKNVGAENRPGIVHRLDKETSGLMVVARNQLAYEKLKHKFQAREVEKVYLGLVWGKMPHPKGHIDWPIGRHKKHGQRMSISTRKPRSAETHYSVSNEYEELSLLEIKPVTGRTHQIRVHFSAAGHPLIGDTRYGKRKSKGKCPRLFLHSFRLSFAHPRTGEKVSFESPLPDVLCQFLEVIESGKSA